ncbi:MAG: hypothetical protein AB1847_19195 [bacterium]
MPNTTTERELGLDYIRAIALILMTSIHFARSIPGSSGSYLSFIGESAPTFFFFAFGMTMDKFLSKAFYDRLKILVLFAYMAIAHNVFMYSSTFFVTEFFFFLLFWQIILTAIEKEIKATRDLYLYTLLVLLVLMLIIPNEVVSNISSSLVLGPFPLLPWGIFVISGLLYSRRDRNGFIHKNGYLVPICLIMISLAFSYLSKRIEWSNFEIVKGPLSTPYFLLFCGVNLFILKLVNDFSNLFSNIPVISKVVNFISRNLLLATVLHYLPVNLGKNLLKIFTSSTILSNYTFFYLSGSFLCNVLLLLLIKIALKIWDVIDNRSVINLLREYGNSSSILIIALCSMSKLYFHCKLFIFLAMVYYALQLRSWKKALRKDALRI